MLRAMIPASLPTALPRGLLGPLGDARADVTALQTALKNLALATQRPDIDPGTIDGSVGTKTVTAVIAAQTLLSKELPTWAFVALQAALAVGAMTSQAKAGVEAAAVPLTVAANTAAAKYKVTPGMMPVMPGFFGPGWYKTPIGIVLILGVAFVGYKLLIEKPKTAAAA